MMKRRWAQSGWRHEVFDAALRLKHGKIALAANGKQVRLSTLGDPAGLQRAVETATIDQDVLAGEIAECALQPGTGKSEFLDLAKACRVLLEGLANLAVVRPSFSACWRSGIQSRQC